MNNYRIKITRLVEKFSFLKIFEKSLPLVNQQN